MWTIKSWRHGTSGGHMCDAIDHLRISVLSNSSSIDWLSQTQCSVSEMILVGGRKTDCLLKRGLSQGPQRRVLAINMLCLRRPFMVNSVLTNPGILTSR